MHSFVRKLISEWRRLSLPFEDETAIVAVSGGADSVSLLLAIDELIKAKKLDLRMIVAHLDHSLRGKESDADAAFVRTLAEDLGYDHIIEKGEIAPQGNLEQNARLARYAFLTRVAESNNAFAVLTAHTLNDQAETFLINLIRGSGPDGLGAMQKIRPLNNGESAQTRQTNLVRPFLGWATREETENFCAEKDVVFRQDVMNDDPSFTRVRVRRELLPLLRTFNPKIVSTLAKTAELISSNNVEIPTELPETLKLTILRELNQPDLYQMLRQWIKHYRGNLRGLNLKHIEAVANLIVSRKSGRTIELPGRLVVVKRDGELCIDVKSVEN